MSGRTRVQHAAELAGKRMLEHGLENISNSDIERAIDEYVHNQRNRAILKRRLIYGICFEPLSEEFGLSTRQIKRIIYKEQDRLLSKLL